MQACEQIVEFMDVYGDSRKMSKAEKLCEFQSKARSESKKPCTERRQPNEQGSQRKYTELERKKKNGKYGKCVFLW